MLYGDVWIKRPLSFCFFMKNTKDATAMIFVLIFFPLSTAPEIDPRGCALSPLTSLYECATVPTDSRFS